MSEEEKIENENGQEEGSVNIYDDNAYIFGEDPSANNSDDQNELKETNKMDYINYKDDYENEEINNMESHEAYMKDYEKESKEKIKNNENEISPDTKDKQNINININQDSNQISLGKNIKNEENKLAQKIQNDTNENNKIKENELKKMKQNEEYEENEVGEGEEEEIENGEMEEENEVEGEAEGEGDEEENVPLVTLKFISICQYCKNSFNSNTHLPYLLKCGHFFCSKCIKESFTDEEGIKCPNDGLVALSIKELKILNNLITDKNVSTERAKKENQIDNEENINGIDNSKLNENNTCKIHKGQKLTHIVAETKQLICVYCAFDLVRKNPKCEVKEIKEKFEEFISEAEKIINLNQNNIKIIQDSLKDIKKNKEIEEKSINMYFDNIFKYLNNKTAEYLSQIDSIFTDNAKKLSQKLEIFSQQIEQGESLKGLIDNYEQNNNFEEILDAYIKLQSIKSNVQDSPINLQEYKFSHDDETKIMKYINNFGDIKTISKYVPFQNAKKDIFNLKITPTPAPTPEEPKKNYFNFNSNPIITNLNNNNNKNSSSNRFNNSTDNQELQNESLYNNNNYSSNSTLNNKKSNNYNFNFNKINPISNNNNSKRNIPSKPILSNNNNNIFRHGSNSQMNNGIMNYINLEAESGDKNYSFNNLNNNKRLRGNRINNGDERIYNNFYNLNYVKKAGDKDNSNQNINEKNINNIKSNYKNNVQNALRYEYKGFKKFNFNK